MKTGPSLQPEEAGDLAEGEEPLLPSWAGVCVGVAPLLQAWPPGEVLGLWCVPLAPPDSGTAGWFLFGTWQVGVAMERSADFHMPTCWGAGHHVMWSQSRPELALTLLQLFLVIHFRLRGHDLKEGLEDTSQVTGVVGLQLVSHTWGRGTKGRRGRLTSLGTRRVLRWVRAETAAQPWRHFFGRSKSSGYISSLGSQLPPLHSPGHSARDDLRARNGTVPTSWQTLLPQRT